LGSAGNRKNKNWGNRYQAANFLFTGTTSGPLFDFGVKVLEEKRGSVECQKCHAKSRSNWGNRGFFTFTSTREMSFDEDNHSHRVAGPTPSVVPLGSRRAAFRPYVACALPSCQGTPGGHATRRGNHVPSFDDLVKLAAAFCRACVLQCSHHPVRSLRDT